MGLGRPSVHPMDAPTTSSLDEYENDPTMAPSQRIADQQYQTRSESPRGSDLAVGASPVSAGPTSMSARALATTASSAPITTGETMTDTARASTHGGGEELQQAKSERRLVFADESGGVLAEITYSSRTHYSKQAGNGALPAGRACCVIS